MTRRRLLNVRAVWAIAAKDITEAIRNRTTLTVLGCMVFLVVCYTYLPYLEPHPQLTVRVYSQGDSGVASWLEDSPSLQVISGYSSLDQMLRALAHSDWPELGVVIPAGFDVSLREDPDNTVLRAYVLRWVRPQAAEAMVRTLESELARLTGHHVAVDTSGGTVHMRPDSHGLGLPVAMGICFAVLMVGVSLVPNLVLDEKMGHTLEALLVSPAGPLEVTIAKALAGLFYGTLVSTFALALNYRIVVQWQWALIVAIAGSAFSVALGLLLGSLVEVRAQLAIWSSGAIVPTYAPLILSFVGQLLPAWLARFLRWTPSVAFVTGLQVSFSDQRAWGLYAPHLAVLAVYSAALLACVVWRFNRADR